MDTNRFVDILNRSRFAGLSPRFMVSISMVVLVTMPVAYLLMQHWSFIAVWLFVISQIVLICQGVFILMSCGMKKRFGRLRYYGVCLVLYGAGSIGMTFWFTALAAFGGPARDQIPLFLTTLWIIAVAVCIPAGMYLRRQDALVRNNPPRE